MKRKTIKWIKDLKNKKKFSCLSAYTASITKIIDRHIDVILVGDSVGTAIYGMKNTQGVTLDMMILHGKTVFNSSKNAFTMIDMPFNTYRNKKEALINAKKLLKSTKCQAVKLETDIKTIDIVKYLHDNNIIVISHIGVTPQKFKDFKKIRSVGNTFKQKKEIVDLAYKLEKAGSSMIVLECIKEKTAKEITNKIKIPTIGIGASLSCDGQILVVNDILDIENIAKKPKFIKSYTNIEKIINKAVKNYASEVVNKKFPKMKNTY
jgi:3-methyl-2-oxobutanoate hydroxymethyltransferase